MLNAFNERLQDLANAYTGVTYVDMRSTVPSGQWFDELHPDSLGFSRIADELKRSLN